MFIGHYGAAFAARAARPSLPLWQLFIAVQLVDFAWAGLVLAGIEKLRITPGFMEASILDLHHMPYTHSLVAVCIWALAAGALYGVFRRGESRLMAGIIIGLAVFSHWLTDFIAHGPDLALWFGGPKVGLGLWNSLFWTQLVELGLLAIGGALYLATTKPKNLLGRVAPWLLLGFMAALQIYNHLPVDHPPPIPQFAWLALFGFSLLTVLAWAADSTRRASSIIYRDTNAK